MYLAIDFSKLHPIPVGRTPIKLKRISGEGYAGDQVQTQARQLRHSTSSIKEAKDQMQRLKHGYQNYSKVASEHLVATCVCPYSLVLSDQVYCFSMLVNTRHVKFSSIVSFSFSPSLSKDRYRSLDPSLSVCLSVCLSVSIPSSFNTTPKSALPS